jgi:hypothetical protein
MAICRSWRAWRFSPNFPRGLVLAQTEEDHVPEKSIILPAHIRDLRHKLWTGPMDFWNSQRAAKTLFPRWRFGEGHRLDGQGPQVLVEHCEGLDRHARSYAARINQTAIRLVVAQQQRPKQRSRALGLRLADNDELCPEALALNPGTTIAGQIGTIQPLRDDAFETMFACRPAKDFPIAAFVIAIGNPYRRLPEQRRQTRFPFRQRQPRNILPLSSSKSKAK